MHKIIKVLVVDDSAYVRKVVKEMLSRSPFLDVVGIARDGREALEKVEELNPDVVTCDLIMPNMDGVAFVREQMQRQPVPIVIMSVASESGGQALEALEAGAVDFVQKPTALAIDKIFEVSDLLIEKVKIAAGVSLSRLQPKSKPVLTAPVKKLSGTRLKNLFDIIVVGISTGGPQALRHFIPQLPADFSVPLAIVMHMPIGYTEMYANKLNEISKLNVREAKEGDEVRAGVVLLAPAGKHLNFRRAADKKVVTYLDLQPFDTPHRPSVDVLFQSAAHIYGERVLGVVMTGMGSDGKQGAAWIKAKGGSIFTEAEETCVVYGMPSSVDEAGLSDRSVSLYDMTAALMEVI